jgi:hypothetical protein
MPYVVVAADGRLFAGLADGQIWESTDRGESWRACVTEGDPIMHLHARSPTRAPEPSLPRSGAGRG